MSRKRASTTSPAVMSDKERILLALAGALASTQICAKGNHYYPADFADSAGTAHVHFAHYRPPVVGDLVLCQTSGAFGGPHPYMVAWYVEHEPRGSGSAKLREIGTDRLCNMDNERFLPIVGLTPLQLLEGEQYLFNRKVRKAFAKGDEYLYRFGGLEFPEGWAARVTVREAHGGSGSLPFTLDIPFTKRTSVKAVLAAMRAGGYGSRPFEHLATAAPTGPTMSVEFGSGGVTTIVTTT